MSHVSFLLPLALLALIAPGAAALVGEVGICPVWEEGVAVVCVSEYGFTNSPDRDCSGPGEYYFGIDSAYASVFDGLVVLSVNAWASCGSSEDGSARSSTESVSAEAFAASQYVGVGWWAFSEDDGAGSTASSCEEWALAHVAGDTHSFARECDGGSPPASPGWGMLVP